ncbi:unnamed protein product [Closterium sp. Naga37s-1]|nr:unnamed protein product [Closterium sp. Naga37s-1]
MERRLLDRLDDVEKELRRSHAGSASPSAPRAAPVVPLSALLPHNPFGSPARSERPLPVGMGFVGAGGGPPWAQFAPPRPLPAPRDLAVSSHRARASALLPPMKEVPTATLARLWSLAASLQSLEWILQESFDSMPAMKRVEAYELEELRDSKMPAVSEEAIVDFADLALDCIKSPGTRRPTMKDVAYRLSALIAKHCPDKEDEWESVARDESASNEGVSSGDVPAVSFGDGGREPEGSDGSHSAPLERRTPGLAVREAAMLRHEHLVQLLGYCMDYNIATGHLEQILVYEFVPHGNLSNYLHSPPGATRVSLSFEELVCISLGVAEGLAYLHHSLYPPIVHRDVKPANILIGDGKTVKLGDFGLVMTDNLEVAMPGYLDPEYGDGKIARTASDAYSFGVVLLEMVSGKRAVLNGSDTAFSNQHISIWANKLVMEGKISKVVMEGLKAPRDAITMFIGLAMDCLKRPGALRPNMRDVAQRLTNILAIVSNRS